MTQSKTGILITNIGTPNEPTPKAVKQYLAKFLHDKRVIELPRIIWCPILHGIILNTRPKKSAKLYEKIWTKDGSPLLVHCKNISDKLQDKLKVPVELGMNYSDPSIPSAIDNLIEKGVSNIIALPLYPQYSATTSAATFDIIAKHFKNMRNIPSLSFIDSYSTCDPYIDAITNLIKTYWDKKSKINHLLFSFHGIPQSFVDKGDKYAYFCQQTVDKITKKLQIPTDAWSISFQSRLGFAKWLGPYTDNVLKELPEKGITDVDVICPGFAVDCLETLEEINIRGKEIYQTAGGKTFNYINALNASDLQINMLAKILNIAKAQPILDI